MHGDAQVKGLQAAAGGVPGGKGAAHLVEDALVLADRLADHQAARVFQGFADAFATGYFAHAGVAAAVLEDDDIAREIRPMGAAEVEQHAVVAGHGDDLEMGHYGSHGKFLKRLKEVC